MEYQDYSSLKQLLESNKENQQLILTVESIQVVNQHEVCNIIEKCTENVEHLRDLFVKHLNPEEIKEKDSPSFTITSSDKATYTIAIKQKAISLGDIDRLHRVFPNLKSISLYMFNLRYDKEDDTVEANADNSVSSIDITLNTFPVNMSKLVMYIFNGYGKHLTTLKMKKGGNVSNKDKKWQDPPQVIVDDGKLLLKHKYQLPKLETVEVCHFYQSFPTAAFAEALSESNCALHHAAFIGVAQSDFIVMHLKKMAKETLRTLALGTQDYPKLQDLDLFPLNSLSLRWADKTAIDVNAVLNALPQLKSLDLGYDVEYSQLQESKTKLKHKTHLQSITLHRGIIDEKVLDTIAADVPSVTKLTLSSCKFGSSRVSMEEKITLLNYRLKELVLDNCALHFNKKDSIEKRHINKLNINIDSGRKYTAKIASKARASMAKYEHVSNVGNQFSYICFSETTARPTNTLTIMLKSIGCIKLDTMGLKAVQFQSDAASPEQTLAELDGDNYGDWTEDVVEESIATEAIVVEEQLIEEGDEEIVEEQVVEKIEEEIVVAPTDGSLAATEDNSEYQLLTASEARRIKRLQEMDKDFTTPTETDATSDDSDMEESIAEQRSMRARQTSAITTRELSKRKRVNHESSDDFDEQSDSESESQLESESESESQSESEEEYKPVRSARETKRIKSIKYTKPIIKVYPSKRLAGGISREQDAGVEKVVSSKWPQLGYKRVIDQDVNVGSGDGLIVCVTLWLHDA
ncbi:hypothetical protein MBANPS3_009002 [Mucor bainieri]